MASLEASIAKADEHIRRLTDQNADRLLAVAVDAEIVQAIISSLGKQAIVNRLDYTATCETTTIVSYKGFLFKTTTWGPLPES